jgi:PHP family Zn ribbon phosphoesterase
MKTMTCRQLGGACDKKFHGNTFEEIAEQSKKHGMEMFQAGDKEHMKAMEEMRKLMTTPDSMKDWMASKRKEFEGLPEEK